MKRFSIIIMSFLILGSCSIFNRGFIVRHKTKNINLKGFDDSIKIGYETDSAIIYFGYGDVKKVVADKLNSGKLDSRWDHAQIKDLKTNLKFLDKIKANIIVSHYFIKNDSTDINEYMFAGFIDQWIFKELVFKKRALVYNKESDNFENKIIYHFIRDRLGSESCYYTFNNGTQIHYQTIAIGE